jgi:serine/threonine protein kinase
VGVGEGRGSRQRVGWGSRQRVGWGSRQHEGSHWNTRVQVSPPCVVLFCSVRLQMLAAKQCASGYSGVKADMWAAGVLLFVMLLGAFPFDHAENLDPNCRQASSKCVCGTPGGGGSTLGPGWWVGSACPTHSVAVAMQVLHTP